MNKRGKNKIFPICSNLSWCISRDIKIGEVMNFCQISSKEKRGIPGIL